MYNYISPFFFSKGSCKEGAPFCGTGLVLLYGLFRSISPNMCIIHRFSPPKPDYYIIIAQTLSRYNPFLFHRLIPLRELFSPLGIPGSAAQKRWEKPGRKKNSMQKASFRPVAGALTTDDCDTDAASAFGKFAESGCGWKQIKNGSRGILLPRVHACD